MKKRIIAYTLPLLLSVGSIAYSAPLALFEQDYERINNAVLDASFFSQFKARVIAVEAVEKSGNVADFTTKLLIDFNDKESLEATEAGEIVFTNYAESKGVATIISKADIQLNSLKEAGNTILLKIDNVANQSQIDRENKHFKFATQYPKIELINPDTEKRGTITIESATANGIYGFSDEFEKIKNVNATYKTGPITFDLDDQNNAVKGFIESSLVTAEIDNEKKIQKTVIELLSPKILSANSGAPFNESLFDKISYTAGADEVDSKPRIYGDFKFDNFTLKLAERDVVAKFGNFVLDIELLALAPDLFDKLENISINGLSGLEGKGVNDAFKLEDYFVEGSSVEFAINGDLAGADTKNRLKVTPKIELVKILAETDLEDSDAVGAIFDELTFFEFVKQYITEIDLSLNAKNDYIIELGSGVLLATGETTSMESARSEMKEVYQQFVFMTALMNTQTPLVEFVDESVRINIQYKDNTWTVNGHVVDLELIASLLG